MKKRLDFVNKSKISDLSLNFASPDWSLTTATNSTNSIRQPELSSEANLFVYQPKEDKNESKTKINDDRVRLNVGGVIFETSTKTLRNVPNSRLSNLRLHDENFDSTKKEYFFDRSPYIFDYILNFYRTGELHLPVNECGSILKNELEFWKLNEGDILPCCWLTYSKMRDFKDTLQKFDKIVNLTNDNCESLLDKEKKIGCFKSVRNKFWTMSEYPFSSFEGRVFSAISMFFVLLSLISVVFVSYRPWYINYVYVYNTTTKRNIMISGYPSLFFKISDMVCAVFFTFEFLLRLVCCPSLVKFVKSLYNWIELIALIGIYIQIVPSLVDPNIACYDASLCTSSFVRIITILQIIRISRLIKLFKNYTGMRILLYTFKSSLRELCLILSLILSGVTVFASLIYAVEGDPDNTELGFSDMTVSLWFAIVTMTTVGFGDVVPSTLGGRLIGFLCAISGVLVVAFTVPVAVNNFTFFYNYAHSRLKHTNLKRTVLNSFKSELKN